DRVFGLDSLLFPETAGALGFYDIRMLDALYVQRYYDYIRLFVEPQVVAHFSGGLFGIDEEKTPAHYSQNPMFDVLGVRYLVATQPIDQIPSPDAAVPQAQWKAVQQVDNVLIYENADAGPRAFVVTDVDVVKDVDAAKAAFAAVSQ